MKKPMKLMVGDVVTTKKNHPCGSNVFTLTRVGMDIRMKCHGCGKEIWIDRPDLEKRIKKLVSAEESQEQENPSLQEEK